MRYSRRFVLPILAAVASLSIALLAGCATPSHHGALATDRWTAARWIGAWGASPVAAAVNGPGFNNQTLRLIVHPTLGGDTVRIRIANTFASKELVIGAASIAVQESGAAVVAGSSRALTFSGRGSVSIPPGAIIVSDPVTLAVLAQHSLTVSIFLPKETVPATAHPGANQTSFVSSAGNFVASDDATSFATTLQSWPFLTAVEVKTLKHARTIVAFGDSITDGFKSTVDANRRWPDYLAARLLAAGRNVAVVNQGISGNRLLHDAAAGQLRFGSNALSRFDRDVLTVSGASHVVVMIGINDIGMGSAARNPEEAITADDLIAGYRQLALRAHAHGLKIIGATLTPFAQAAYYSEQGEQKRQAVNGWIRTNKDFDGVIDFDRATRDPGKPSQLLAAYDSGDHLHPSDAGYRAMAESIELGVFE